VRALGCVCDRPLVWKREPGVCRTCHLLTAPAGVSAMTWETALAIAEIAVGRRRAGNHMDENDETPR
jgi:hypothetical protein